MSTPPVETSDMALVSAYAEEADAGAVCALVNRHYSGILGVCRRYCRDEHLAQDACQLAFIALIQNARVVHSNPQAWLRRAALNACKSIRRAQVARRRREQATARPETSPRQDELDFSVHEALRSALATLTPDEMQLLQRLILQGVTQQAVAQERQVSQQAVSKQLARVLGQLRVVLSRRGVVWSAVLSLWLGSRAVLAKALSAGARVLTTSASGLTKPATVAVVAACTTTAMLRTDAQLPQRTQPPTAPAPLVVAGEFGNAGAWDAPGLEDVGVTSAMPAAAAVATLPATPMIGKVERSQATATPRANADHLSQRLDSQRPRGFDRSFGEAPSLVARNPAALGLVHRRSGGFSPRKITALPHTDAQSLSPALTWADPHIMDGRQGDGSPDGVCPGHPFPLFFRLVRGHLLPPFNQFTFGSAQPWAWPVPPLEPLRMVIVGGDRFTLTSAHPGLHGSHLPPPKGWDRLTNGWEGRLTVTAPGAQGMIFTMGGPIGLSALIVPGEPWLASHEFDVFADGLTPTPVDCLLDAGVWLPPPTVSTLTLGMPADDLTAEPTPTVMLALLGWAVTPLNAITAPAAAVVPVVPGAPGVPGVSAAVFAAVSVPEPSSALLLGLGGWLLWPRRRRNSGIHLLG